MDISRSVQATIRYANFFNFPLTSDEIHFWLISPHKVTLKEISPHLPKTRDETIKTRSRLSEASNKKVNFSKKLINVLKFIPGVRMIALTGSVAAQNSHPSDDIDLFFITSPHTLWIVRPLVLYTISLFFRRRYPGEDHAKATDAFCPNLWLDSLSLSVPENKRNLYTAHEVLQVRPLLDRGGTYQSFLRQNLWAKKYLANAYHLLTSQSPLSKGEASPQAGRGIPPRSVIERSPRRLWQSIPILVFAPFNLIFFFFQFLYMRPKKTTETVHLHAAYLHTTDFAKQLDNYLKKHR